MKEEKNLTRKQTAPIIEYPRRRPTGPALGRALPEPVREGGESVQGLWQAHDLTQGRTDDETSSDRSSDGNPEKYEVLVSKTLVNSSWGVLRVHGDVSGMPNWKSVMGPSRHKTTKGSYRAFSPR